MIDRFKKVFIICSTDFYDFLEEHKDEILEKHKNKKIEMPYLFGTLDEEYEKMIEAADIALSDKGINSIRKSMELAEDTLLEIINDMDSIMKEDAKKRMKRASTCIYIGADYHPTKMIEDLSVAATVETTMELLEARHKNIHIEAIDPTEFVRAKQKKL